MAQERKRGRWNYRPGIIGEVRTEGWPEPGLLGGVELVQVSVRAQAEKLVDQAFWEQVAERTHTLRDVLSVGDVAVILDALVSVNHRHLLLMRTLVRELADDVDKLSLVEIAVVANAYAHFQCISPELLEALEAQTVQLLTGVVPPYVQSGGGLDSDPGSLALIARSFVGVEHRSRKLMEAIGSATKERVDTLSFPVLSDLLTSFAKAGFGFQAEPMFWAVVASKASGARMATLCPAFRAVAELGVVDGPVRNALVEEIRKGLQSTPAPALQLESGPPVSVEFPPFAPAEVPDTLTCLLDSRRTPKMPAALPKRPQIDEDDFTLGFGQENQIAITESSTEVDQAATNSELVEPADLRPRWYNAVSRQPLLPAVPTFHNFDATRNFQRNRQGFVVGEALDGLRKFRQLDGSENSLQQSEIDLLTEMIPILSDSLPGLDSRQLAAAADLYALRVKTLGSQPCEIVQNISSEAVRKLATFKTPELKLLQTAVVTAGISNPYLEKAKNRRFPVALRKELHQQAAKQKQKGEKPKAHQKPVVEVDGRVPVLSEKKPSVETKLETLAKEAPNETKNAAKAEMNPKDD